MAVINALSSIKALITTSNEYGPYNCMPICFTVIKGDDCAISITFEVSAEVKNNMKINSKNSMLDKNKAVIELEK